jgi:hypothetical protein
VSAPVSLNGLNSTGVARDAASYRWTQTAGPAVPLSDPNAPETIFTAPETNGEGESLGFQLTVANGGGAQSEDSCIVNVSDGNAPPVAEAGPNQAVYAGQIVELGGSKSSAAGPISSFNWRQISGIPVTLSDPSAMQTTFVAPDAGQSLVFELSVSDQAGLRSRDTCIVNVIANAEPPAAQAGASRTVVSGRAVVLDGSGSTDSGGIASFRWRQLSGQPVVLSDPAGIKTAFTAPAIDLPREDLVFELTVCGVSGLQDKGKVVITVVPF